MTDLAPNTATTRMVFMTDSADHVSGKTGLTLTITASKAGAAFATITPTVTERGNGWYALALTTSHTDTLGDFALHVSATGADPTDKLFNVNQMLATVATNLDATISSVKSKTDNLPAAPAAVGDIPSAATTAAAVRTNLATELGRIDVATSTRLATAGYTAPPSAVSNATAVRTELATELARVDAAITTRATPAQVSAALATYDGPTAAELDAAIAQVRADIAALPVAPTTAQIADRFLGRTIAGGADGGRTVRDAIRASRNRVEISGTTLTVYAEDDTTPAWTATIATASRDALQSVDPA